MIRGVAARQPPTRGSWLQYTPREFYCRNCGVQLCVVARPARYVFLSLMLLLPILYVLGWRGTLPRPFSDVSLYLIAILILAACEMRWGHVFRVADRSNNRWSGPR